MWAEGGPGPAPGFAPPVGPAPGLAPPVGPVGLDASGPGRGLTASTWLPGEVCTPLQRGAPHPVPPAPPHSPTPQPTGPGTSLLSLSLYLDLKLVVRKNKEKRKVGRRDRRNPAPTPTSSFSVTVTVRKVELGGTRSLGKAVMVATTGIEFRGCSFPLGGYSGKAALLQQTGFCGHWNPEDSRLCQARARVQVGRTVPENKGHIPGTLKTLL